jgi:hypothetical protein
MNDEGYRCLAEQLATTIIAALPQATLSTAHNTARNAANNAASVRQPAASSGLPYYP